MSVAGGCYPETANLAHYGCVLTLPRLSACDGGFAQLTAQPPGPGAKTWRNHQISLHAASHSPISTLHPFTQKNSRNLLSRVYYFLHAKRRPVSNCPSSVHPWTDAHHHRAVSTVVRHIPATENNERATLITLVKPHAINEKKWRIFSCLHKCISAIALAPLLRERKIFHQRKSRGLTPRIA